MLTPKEENIKSPFVPPVPFDYDKLQDDKVVPTMKAIIKIMDENADFIFFPRNVTKEEQEAGYGIASKKIMNLIEENGVHDCDLQFMIEKMQQVFFMLLSIVAKYKVEIEQEYLARCLETRDPGTGEYSRNFATLADLFKAVEKKRLEQEPSLKKE